MKFKIFKSVHISYISKYDDEYMNLPYKARFMERLGPQSQLYIFNVQMSRMTRFKFLGLWILQFKKVAPSIDVE